VASTLFLYNPALIIALTFSLSSCKHSDSSLKDRDHIGDFPGTTFEGGVSLAAGDFDGDGDLDFTGSNTRDYGLFLYTNNGKGHFTDKGRVENLPGTIFKGGVSLAAGDFDGDGDLDLIGSNTRDYGVFLYANNGRGEFTDKGRVENLPGTTFEGGVSLAVGDFDGDGDLDFIGSNTRDYGVFLYTNNGRGEFTDKGRVENLPGTTFEGGVSLAAGDFDGDGDPDFIGSNTRDYGVFLYTNNGKGQFTDKGRVENLPGTTFKGGVSLAAGDFDDDGDLDFIGSNTRDYGVFLYLNNGKGQFTDKGRIENLPGTTFEGGVSLAVGDFDGDGDLDFIGSNTDHYGIYLFYEGNDSKSSWKAERR
jgi:hypothetical protein